MFGRHIPFILSQEAPWRAMVSLDSAKRHPQNATHGSPTSLLLSWGDAIGEAAL